MTLIVAKKILGEVYLISDSLVTFPDMRRTDIGDVTNKIINFSNHVVAVSGVIGAVFEHWKNLPPNITTADQILECVKLRDANNGHLDFIVVAYDGNVITKISDTVTADVDMQWIGLKSAFEKFQEIRSQAPDVGSQAPDVGLNFETSIVRMESDNEGFNSSYSRDILSFRKVLEMNVEGVGGFIIPFTVTNTERKFGFYLYADSGVTPQVQSHLEFETVQFGFNQPEFGSYAISFAGSSSGFQVTIPQLNKFFEWHSPFVSFEETPKDPFG